LSVHDVEVMPRIALVYRDPRDLPFAAVVAQHALLLSDWQPGIGWRDVEPAVPVGGEGAWGFVRGEGDEGAQELGGHDDFKGAGRERCDLPGLHEFPGSLHRLAVEGPQLAGDRVFFTQPGDHLTPGSLAVEALGPFGQVRFDFLFETVPVPPQLGCGIPQDMLVVQAE